MEQEFRSSTAMPCRSACNSSLLLATLLLALAADAGVAVAPIGLPSALLVYNASCTPSSSSCLTAGFELFYDVSGA